MQTGSGSAGEVAARASVLRAFIFFGVVLCATIIAAKVFALWLSYTSTVRSAEEHLTSLSAVLSEETRHAVQSVDLVLIATAEEVKGRMARGEPVTDRALYERLRERIAQLPQIRALVVIDRAGTALIHTEAFPPPRVNFSDRDYFDALRNMAGAGFYVGMPVRERLMGEWTYTFSRRVESADGRFLGVIAVGINVPHLHDLYQSLGLGPQGRVLLFRRDGVLLTTHPVVEEVVGRTFAGDPVFRDASAAAWDTVRRAGLIDDERRFIAFRALRDYPLVIAVSSSEKHVLANWRHLAWQVAVGALVAVLIIAISLVLLARQLRVSFALRGELLETAERHRLMVEAATDYANFMLDPHGNIVNWNAGGERLFGYRVEEMLGKPVAMLCPQSGGDILVERLLATAVARDRAVHDGDLVRKDGRAFASYCVISTLRGEDGGVHGFSVLAHDMTGRKLIEKKLRESEARTAAIIHSAMDAIITTDERRNVVLFNAAAEKIFRCRAEEAIGASLDRFIPERVRAAHGRHIERFGTADVTTRKMGARMALSGMRSDGEEFPIDASISQITVEGKKLYTVILRDVTEHKRAEDELDRSYRQLRELSAAMHEVREAERMRIARELHDELAQWLTALKMDVSWLAARLPQSDFHLSDKTDRMKALVDTTVAAVRRIAADLRPVMLDDLGLAPAVEHLLHEFSQRTGIAVSLDVAQDGLEFGDPLATGVYRMLQEALTNVARHAHASEVQVSLKLNDGELALRVRDNGRGMDPQAPKKAKSFGLLGIKERAHTLGGRAGFSSPPQGGTIVEIAIPVARYRKADARHDQSTAR